VNFTKAAQLVDRLTSNIGSEFVPMPVASTVTTSARAGIKPATATAIAKRVFTGF